MKLLIITQKVDKNDPILGFFHRWIEEFAKHVEQLTVICLFAGEYSLPENVTVLSLGKENGESRLKYVWKFYTYIWRERKRYEKVFVHMNQEYVLLGGILWKLFGKKIYMWRNHHAGSLMTDGAALLCAKVFCTSKYSYTAKYKKTVLMPVGIDTKMFKVMPDIKRKAKSILFLSRISPIKKPHILINVLCELKDYDFVASIYGDALDKDGKYFEDIKKKVEECGLDRRVQFFKGIPNYECPKVYNEHEVFVNLSSSGMYDKTIFEAMACGCNVLVSNENLRGEIDDFYLIKEDGQRELFDKISRIVSREHPYQVDMSLVDYVSHKHSLEQLVDKLMYEQTD